LASFQELFRPVVIQALGNALAPAQLRDAVLTAKAVQHNTDLLLGRVLLARGSPNVLHDPLGRRLLVLGFLSHLHSLMVTMSQKSSLIQPANFVSQALIPDTHARAADDRGRVCAKAACAGTSEPSAHRPPPVRPPVHPRSRPPP